MQSLIDAMELAIDMHPAKERARRRGGFPGVNCCSLCGLLILTDQPAEDPSALDLRFGKVPGIIGTAVRRPEVAGPVRAVLMVSARRTRPGLCAGPAARH